MLHVQTYLCLCDKEALHFNKLWNMNSEGDFAELNAVTIVHVCVCVCVCVCYMCRNDITRALNFLKNNTGAVSYLTTCPSYVSNNTSIPMG